MELWMIVSVVCSMLLFWLFVRFASSLLVDRVFLSAHDPAKSRTLALNISTYVEQHFLSVELIREKMLNPANYQKLVPHIESHVDHFLRVRLKEEMPVVGMMIGDRTIAQMKEIFMKELEVLFPEVMQGYVSNLKSDLDIGRLVTERLQAGGLNDIKMKLKPTLSTILLRLQILAAGAGLFTGLAQVAIYFLLSR